jgi:hypothetical protein
VGDRVTGYDRRMSGHPHQAESDEADRDSESTPIGVEQDLEEMAEDSGATTDPEELEELEEPS